MPRIEIYQPADGRFARCDSSDTNLLARWIAEQFFTVPPPGSHIQVAIYALGKEDLFRGVQQLTTFSLADLAAQLTEIAAAQA